MSGFLRLPGTILTSLAGGGDPVERGLLRAGQVSKRLVQLRGLHDLVVDTQPDMAETSGFLAAFDGLAAVQRAHPAVVADLLSTPQVGAWAASLLRLLMSTTAPPHLAHLAHLGAITAAAALRAGVEVDVRVPVRHRVTHIPTHGRAVLRAHHHGLVDCSAGPAGLTIDGEVFDGTNPRWEPIRAIRADAGGHVLEVLVDEGDPYWDTFNLPLRNRISDAEFTRWHDTVAASWRVVAERHPHRLDTMTAAVRCLVPVDANGRLGRISASSADAPGAIALTEPVSPTRLAATLIHESQHYRLHAVHDLRALYEDRPGVLLYSPWRNDPRPLSGVLHGTLAFLGVADFWHREPPGPVSEFEYARHASQLRTAVAVAEASTGLTSFGAAVLAALAITVRSLPAPASDDIARIADDLVEEHRIGWRLRNVTPDEDIVRGIEQAWQADASVIPSHGADNVRAAPPGGDNPLTRLAIAWLEASAEVRALAANPAAFAWRFPGTTPADVRLLEGDYAAARDAVLTAINDGMDTDGAWSRLAVAHRRRCAQPSPLHRHPEAVREVWRRRPVMSIEAFLDHYEAGTSMSQSIRS